MKEQIVSTQPTDRKQGVCRILDRSFFLRDTCEVAQDLLGSRIFHRQESGRIVSARIVETEAYHGFDDKASHASRGLTPRNILMFGPAGYTYVYLCYGIHHLLNIVTCEEGFPAAVLLRGVDQPQGFDGLAIGPGRLTRRMEISRQRNNGIDITIDNALIWIEAGSPPAETIETSPRIGVDYAEEWADKPWRFYLGKAR